MPAASDADTQIIGKKAPPAKAVAPPAPKKVKGHPSDLETDEPADEQWQIEVEAVNVGTYPEKGRLNAWVRDAGERFKIRLKRHFNSEWMIIPGQTEAADAKLSVNGIPIMGHGRPELPNDAPLTTVQNQIQDPLDFLNSQTRG